MSQGKFFGRLSTIKLWTWESGRRGLWSAVYNQNHYRFSGFKGEVLNWWPDTGTVQIQGKDAQQFDRLITAAQGKCSQVQVRRKRRL